jgi:glutamate:GABA antiporter
VPTIGAFVRLALIVIFAISAVVYGFQNGLEFPAGSEFSPTWLGFTGLVPVLFFAFIGSEVPSAAGDEMTDAQRDVPVAVRRGVIAALAMYGIPVVLILMILGGTPLSGLDGFINAMQRVLSVYGGSVADDGTVTLTGAGKALSWLAGLGIIYALLSSGTVWMMGADRSQAAAGFDGSGPRSFGRISERFGTPVVVNVASGVLATFSMVLAFELAGGSNEKYFNVVLGVVLLFTILSYLVVFPSAWRLRNRYPDIERPYRVPGGALGLRICVVLTMSWTVIAAVFSLLPGLFSDGKFLDDAALPDGFTRIEYQLIIIVPLILAIVTGFVFYAMGARTRADTQ